MRIFTAAFFILSSTPFLAFGQADSPIREDMHLLLEKTAREGNTQLSNTRLDDYTTLKMLTYDKDIPLFTYHYTTSILQLIGVTEISEASKNAMYGYHRLKTCDTSFRSFMQIFGLQVSHRFEDVDSGKEVVRITLSFADCPGN